MLNLLPDSQKRALANQQVYEQIRQVSITVLSIGLVLTSVMIVSDRLLQSWYSDLRNEATVNVTDDDRLALEELVHNVTSTSQALTEAQAQFNHPLSYIQLVLRNTPTDAIHIHRLRYDYPTNEFVIEGIAQNREILVNYQDTLESVPEFGTINFPLNNLNQRDQITFTAYATINYEATTN